MSDDDFECEKLREILDELNALEPLPVIGTPEARADHDGWMKRRRAIEEQEHNAEGYALLSIPPEVDVLLRRIKARRRVLFNMKPMPGDEKSHG